MSTLPRGPLRKSSSLVLNEPDPSKLKARATRVFAATKAGLEEVPDSEEERLNHRSETETDASEAEVARQLTRVREVIEISSDEESEEDESNRTTPRKSKRPAYPLGGRGTPTTRRASPAKGHEIRRVSHGSDDEEEAGPAKAGPSRNTKFLPLFLDDSDDEESHVSREETVKSDEWDDPEAILHVDTPKSQRTLKRLDSVSPTRPSPFGPRFTPDLNTPSPTSSQPVTPSTSRRPASPFKRPYPTANPRPASPDKRSAFPDERPSSPSKQPTSPDKPRSASPSKRSPGSPRKPTQKALKEAEAARRAAYAQDLFRELNAQVFAGGLPAGTPLVWNPKLTSTAGRAKYQKSGDGEADVCIELAPKILDCDERIRYTLAHEMCHLATWVIDRNLPSNHDRLFWKWGKRIMAKRADIKISTTHNYEINHKYRWQCCNTHCGKIHGRFSKSIKVETQFCGCGGRLEPLFTTRAPSQRDPDTPKTSMQAVARTPGGSAVIRSPSAFTAGDSTEIRTLKSSTVASAPGTSSISVRGAVIDLCDSDDEDGDGIESKGGVDKEEGKGEGEGGVDNNADSDDEIEIVMQTLGRARI
ncbi:SprT-like family-domain-containing protein [Schizophyllum fasciatum]